MSASVYTHWETKRPRVGQDIRVCYDPTKYLNYNVILWSYSLYGVTLFHLFFRHYFNWTMSYHPKSALYAPAAHIINWDIDKVIKVVFIWNVLSHFSKVGHC